MKLLIQDAAKIFFVAPHYKNLKKIIEKKEGEFYITCEYPDNMPSIQKVGIKLLF